MSHQARTLLALRRYHRLGFAILGPSDGRQGRGQGVSEQLIDGLYRDNFQPTLYIVRDFGEVLLILLRDQDSLKPTSQSRKQLFFEASDRQDPTPQRDLAGHRDVALYRDAAEYRNNRC